LEKRKKNREWVDFAKKMVYVCDKLFDGDKEKLQLYFSNQALAYKQKNRKKTIENWLTGKTKKPNGFHLSQFKISEYQLNGEKLFSENYFKKWAFPFFKKRVDLYLTQKESFDAPNEMGYIYFFYLPDKKLSYWKISYPNRENENIIRLTSPSYTENMSYDGNITNYQNMIYISVHNKFDQMHYIFKNHVSIYRKELKVFGVAQCVDALTREPKCYLALLSSSKLTKEEELRFSHKLNFSNLLIADDFSYSCVQEENYFMENFLQKVHDLSRDIEHYNIHEHFSKEMYYDIIIKEFRSYIALLEKAIFHSDYPIDHKRQSILFALEGMCQHEPVDATILYLLNHETLNILDSKNSIMEMQLKLAKKEKLNLTYLFIIEDLALISTHILEKLRYLEANNIKVLLTRYTQSIYSKILIMKGKDFAIYKRKNDRNDNHVSKNADVIDSLTFEVEELSKFALPLNQFVEKYYHLNGTWYHYTYRMRGEEKSFQEVILRINNSDVKAEFPEKTNHGELLKMKDYTLILMEQSVIRIHNINLRDNIFVVSIIGKLRKIHYKDVLLFGLMSRRELKEKEIMSLLDKIHQKDEKEFWLKVSSEFESVLASF